MTYKSSFVSTSLSIILSAVLVGCGGGGNQQSNSTTPIPVPEPANVLPTAHAGDDMTAFENSVVSLIGSGEDTDGSIVSYQWSQIAGSEVTINSPNQASTTLTLPDVVTDETLTFELTVTDDKGDISKDTVDVIVTAVLSVIDVTPVDGATEVDRKSKIIVQFSDPLDLAHVEQHIKLYSADDEVVALDSVVVEESIVTITTDKVLRANIDYRLSVGLEIQSATGVSLIETFSTSFTTKAASWSTPYEFEQSGGYSNVAMNDKGDMIIASWGFNDETNAYEVKLTEKQQGGWSDPRVVSVHGSVYSPTITMDNNGNAIMTWDRRFDDQFVVMEYRDGQWGEPWVINTTDFTHSVAMNDDGYAVIAWINQSVLHLNQYIDGQWQLSTFATDGHLVSSLVKLRDQHGMVLMRQLGENGESYKIYVSQFEQNVWHQPELIGEVDYFTSSFDFDLDSNGDSIVIWRVHGGDYDLYKNERRGGQWLGQALAIPADIDIRFSDVLMNDNGEAIIYWESIKSGWNGDISYRKFAEGGWQDITTVAEGGKPRMALNDEGKLTMVWEYYVEGLTHSEVKVSQQHNENGTWTEPMLLSVHEDTLNRVDYKVKTNYAADAVVIWNPMQNEVRSQYVTVFE